jgi:hypothetical protein
VAGILEARSPRFSEVAQHLPNKPSANQKAPQRFIAGPDLEAALRLRALRPVRPDVRYVQHAAPGSDGHLCRPDEDHESLKDLIRLLVLGKLLNKSQQYRE